MKSHELIVRRRVKLSIFVAGSLLLRLAQGMQGFASLGKMIKNMSGKPWMGRGAGLLMSLGEWGASVLFAALEVVVGDGGCCLLDGGVEGTETVGDAQAEGAARRGADGEIFAVAARGVGYGPEILTGRTGEVAGDDSDSQAVILEETAGEYHFIPQT